ncbi:uncharacterized protein (DUF305 family) [Kribbella orskensis]|uniref:Uncharacterized protein (DUF305 family) n=1 Tax=Kribbella orskensis TaxID=2512216 RepID=A0ABY2BG42_9ACTN|nr:MULTISPECIES: DUF305 domain-containing protein [Kribbella]TCN35609.1 uncharacterized protein (DUF305 family) [Kribbella sp. VKM Ac-2500]TCO17151.1 uncharacterized protein (DUF305 family) [Kribbella orskensis]
MRHHLWNTAAPTALIVLGSLTLAACGDDADSGSMPGMDHGAPSAGQTTSTAPAGDFNEADVTFSTQMIPHHQQAVQMASMAGYTAITPEVKELATAIKAAQDPEIKTLSGWLTTWGKPVPTPSHGDHSSNEMPGMMTEDELSDLGNAKGAMFDRMWTQMMIEHHQGAVTMAKTEQTSGKNAEAVALAQKIETDQNREIATMQRLLGQLPVS